MQSDDDDDENSEEIESEGENPTANQERLGREEREDTGNNY